MTEEQVAEGQTVEEPKTEKKSKAEMEAEMYAYLKDQFGDSAPDKEKVAAWKNRYRRVRLLPLSDEEVYLIRPIKRNEYKALLLDAAPKNPEAANAQSEIENFLRERIVSTCVLWPKLDTAQFADTFAGTVDSLYTVIMDASNFISQEALFTVVREL